MVTPIFTSGEQRDAAGGGDGTETAAAEGEEEGGGAAADGAKVRVARWLMSDFLIICVWPFSLEGLWLHSGTLQNILPFLGLRPFPILHPGAIQGM